MTRDQLWDQSLPSMSGLSHGQSDKLDLFFQPGSDGPAVNESNDRSDVFFGMPLEQYAREKGVQVGEIWRLIRNGELVARPIKGVLHVFPDGSLSPEFQNAATARSGGVLDSDCTDDDVATAVMDAIDSASSSKNTLEAGELPSLPPECDETFSVGRSLDRTQESKSLTQYPEVALLLDHLSLAKEENKEIIRLTQDTIQRVTAMSENIVAMKNEIIEAKEAQIRIMKERLDEQSIRIRSLHQEKEDLEILVKMLPETE